jgi:hypothetical protein
MQETKEANILSYRILFDDTGKLITELSGLPLKDVEKVFTGHEAKIMETIIKQGREKLQKIHHYLEGEISAIKN